MKNQTVSMKPRRNSTTSLSPIFSFLLLASFLIVSCGDDGGGPTPPDFSTVPAPYDTAEAQKVTLSDGLIYYELIQGSGPFEVVARDRISVHFTGRIKSTEEVFDSSYKNGSTDPQTFLLTSTIDGFREGVIGMKIGGKRKIIVPPELGYQSQNSNLVGDTLVYDIKLVDIL